MPSSIANNLTTKSCIEAIINDEKIVSISFQTKLSDNSKDYFHLMNVYLSENKEFLHFFQDRKKYT